MDKPGIPHPKDPFVLIFFRGGADTEPHYGLITDGSVSEVEWKTILEHVGFLAPYSLFKPSAEGRWSVHGQDTAVRAAQSIGRETGGGIMGAPKDNQERKNLLKAYNEDIALRMTHIFHDDERDPGTPGGGGDSRLEFVPTSLATTFSTSPSADFQLPNDADNDEMTISFGAYFGDYAYGGETTVLSDRNNNFGPTGQGWYIKFHNHGGYTGDNVISFYSDGIAHVSSPPFPVSQAILWNTVHISVEPVARIGKIMVTVAVDGVGSSTAILSSPSHARNIIKLGDPHGVRNPVYYDDIRITRSTPDKTRVSADYTFERDTNDNEIKLVHDVTANGHELRPDSENSQGAKYAPTSGVDPVFFDDVRRTYITALLSSREDRGLPPPRLLTNWRLSDKPGRFAAWRNAGFTNGSTEYYLYENPPHGVDKITAILNRCSKTAQWAWLDGSIWQHAWIGQARNDDAVLTPDEYQALIIMAVLDGNRWFSVFTAMSDGHLALPTMSHRDKAIITADALYKMAQAASWFQSTSGGLHESVQLPADSVLEKGTNMTFRARINLRTNEMWFATYSAHTMKLDSSQLVKLSTQSGTLTDLESGTHTTITDGYYLLPPQGHVGLYYFKPAT